MITADTEFYTNVYGGVQYADITALLTRAANIIDTAVFLDESLLADTQIDYVKKAICAEAEYIGAAGGIASAVGTSSSGSGFTLGKFSVTAPAAGTAGAAAASGAIPCDTAYAYLERACVTYRGVGVI
jgi:hypothetical protein